MLYVRKILRQIPYFKKIVCFFRQSPKNYQLLARDITELRMSLVKKNSPKFEKEADYILQHLDNQEEWFVPYKMISSPLKVKSGFDWRKGLPFVEHVGKKLFFPAHYSEDFCEYFYRGYIEKECLLGGWYREKQPHQYESSNCKVEKDDVLVDVGCAEALFALDHIDKVSKAYLIESDDKWIPALKATFHDYLDKVIIVKKQIAGIDSEETVTLKTLLQNDLKNPLYIKMDIEGAEAGVLNSSKDFLESANNVKMAVCTYHRLEDADSFSHLFEEMGYDYEFSEGYMYLYRNCNPVYPYFRRGIIRGWKRKKHI